MRVQCGADEAGSHRSPHRPFVSAVRDNREMGNVQRGLDQMTKMFSHPDFLQPIHDGVQREREPLPDALRLADHFTCGVCGRSSWGNRVELEVDHLIPVAAGGSDHTTNLWTLCRECNQQKSNRFTTDVRAVRPRMIVAYCEDETGSDDENLFTAQRVYCAWCHDLRTVSIAHARPHEMSLWIRYYQPGPRHLKP
jgi:5-methylcytosine-specific restriction protein A